MDTSLNLKTHNFIVPVVDTDSCTISKPDGSAFSKEEIDNLTTELNSLFPKGIRWEFEFYIPRMIILKAKNYIMFDGKSIKLKGSSLRDQKKEPALKEMMDKMIHCLVYDKAENLVNIYNEYIREAYNVTDIRRWCAKKTITKAVLECATNDAARLNERKVYDAVKGIPGLQEGDKVHIYPCIISQTTETKELKNGKTKSKVIKQTGLSIAENWDREEWRDEDRDKLMERVIATTDIFNNLLGDDTFIDYSLVKNRPLLNALVNFNTETNLPLDNYPVM